MFRKQLEILTVGDVTTDAFIRLKDPHVHAEMNHDTEELCMGFGSKIPFEYVRVVKAVGNAANASVAAARLGLRSAILTEVGDDQNGRDCILELRENGVDTAFVRVEKNRATNYHFVLWYGNERTILVNHGSFEYRLPEGISRKKAPGMPPKWVYLSSLGHDSYAFEMALMDFLHSEPRVKLAFQPGTFQLKEGAEKLASIYKRSDLLVVNAEEAKMILNRHPNESTEENDIKSLLRGIMDLGPKLVAITDGTAGSYLYDGDHFYRMPIYPDPKPAFERTGCGDAWTSTFVAALAKGKTPLEALTWAPINSMSVAQFIGSREGLLTEEQLEWWLGRAPEDYKPQEF